MHVVHDRGAAGAFPARREGGGSSRHRPTARDVRDAALHWGRTREPGIRAALAAAIDPDLATWEAAYRESLERRAEREAGLFRTVGSTARRLVQAGLFDSRAVTAARVRQRVGAELLEDVAAHQASLALDSALTRRLEPVAFLWSDPKL
jgi:hypothetical protein